MSAVRRPRACLVRPLPCLILALIVGTGPACSEPPDREMNQAQGAVDAARAAGAEQYAADEFAAAVEALEKSREAVSLGDYRLALNHALDARERAQEAAKQAAAGRAVVRGQLEAELGAIAASRARADTTLERAAAARLPNRDLADAREGIRAADQAVQEARADMQRGEDLSAEKSLVDVRSQLDAMIAELESRIAARTARRRR